MSNEKWRTIKVKPILGDLPEYGTEWWSDEQWAAHNKYVEELKAQGKYLTEGEEVTLNFREYDAFKPNEPNEDMFKNFGLLIPNGTQEKRPYIPYDNKTLPNE